jgi:hypothetical protein
VPLEASVVPGVELGGELNSYLLDFFKHGDAAALARENGVGGAEVWFVLREFELMLAAIGASLEGFLNLEPGEVGGQEEEVTVGLEEGWGEGQVGVEENEVEVENLKAVKKKKKVVADSWEDEDVSEGNEEDTETSAESVPSWGCDGDDQSLVKVYKAFRRVEEEFKGMFKKMWA